MNPETEKHSTGEYMNEYGCRVTTHGQRQVEASLLYPLSCERRTVGYNLDLYLFTPSQLGITKRRYGVERFLEDLYSYTRYAVYAIPFGKLVDPECEISPITRIRKMLSENGLSRDLNTEWLFYELRTLVNIHHGQSRQNRMMVRDRIRDGADEEAVRPAVDLILNNLDRFLEEFRSFHTLFMDPRVSERMREGLRWADEAVSLKTEKEMFHLYCMFKKQEGMESIAEMLRKRLPMESEYRKSRGYPAKVDPQSEEENELFQYREGMLKKWSQGVMYMKSVPALFVNRVAHMCAGAAAAAAMAFAVAATFLTQHYYSSYSVPWAIMIVIAYILKDRIKEILRTLLISRLPNMVSDDARNLIDPQVNKKVGSTRARVRFCKSTDMPHDVQRMRNVEGNPFRDILPPEDVIHYNKRIRFNCKKFMKHHLRLEAITEILRLDLTQWLHKMDDPVNLLSYVDEEGEAQKVEAGRVYHINMIMRLSREKHDDKPSVYRYRLVLSREGIIRVEPIL